MSDYEYIGAFLDSKSRGLSEVESLVQVAYEQGFITREEMPRLIDHLNESGAQFPTDWKLPENRFDQVVFLTAWNQWVECIVAKLMNNGMMLSMMEDDPVDAKRYQLIHHFPKSLDELSLENNVERLLKDTTGHERKLTMHVNVLNRRSLFAIQCMLPLSQKEIRRLLKPDRKVSIVLLHSGNGKFTKLKKLMQPYGLELTLNRMS